MENYLTQYGFSPAAAQAVELVFRMTVLVLAGILANTVAKRHLLKLFRVLAQRTQGGWDDVLLERKVFARLAHLAPALAIYFLASWALADYPQLAVLLQRVASVYMLIVGLLVVNAFLNAAVDICQTLPVSRHHPVKGYAQAVKLTAYFLGGILFIAIVLGKSPWGLLSLLGGLTAVLLLVFKDVLLGFVASVQLTSNNMVSVGDWIEMPKYGADGDVIDISLATVKVRNWDKTISTIPTYALISDSFKNWRGMEESGGRRIKRSLSIDMTTVKFCDDAMLERFRKFQHLRGYLDQKIQELEEYNTQFDFDTTVLINGRRLSNIGVFRAYVSEYLKRHPKIHQELTFLIRHLQPTPHGLPLEIYVFSNDQAWANYEGIQADIFDHILAVVPEFELRVFQHPSGADFAQAFQPSEAVM